MQILFLTGTIKIAVKYRLEMMHEGHNFHLRNGKVALLCRLKFGKFLYSILKL